MNELKKFFTKKCVAITTASLLALYVLTAAVIVPWYAKNRLLPELGKTYQLDVQVEDISFNPFSYKLTVENFEAIHKGEELLGFRKLVVNVEVFDILWNKGLFLEELRLENPRAFIEIGKDRSLSLLKLIPPTEGQVEELEQEEASPFEMPLVEVNQLAILQGHIRFQDLSNEKPYTEEIKDLSFELPHFSTSADLSNKHQLKLISNTGMKLNWQGAVQFNPLSSQGQLILEDFHFAPLAPYYDRLVHVDVPSGKLGMVFNYDLNLLREFRKIKFSWDEITFRDFEARDRDTGGIVQSLNFLQMRDIQWDIIDSSFLIDEIEFNGGELNAVRRDDGSLNLLPRALLDESKEVNPPPTEQVELAVDLEEPSEFEDNLKGAIRSLVWHLTTVWKHSWASTANTVILKEYNISVRDEMLEPAVEIKLENLQVKVDGLKSDEGAEIQMAIEFKLDQLDQKFSSKFTLFPLAGQIKTEIQKFSLDRFNPYIRKWSDFSLNSADFSLMSQSHFQVELAEDQSKKITLSSDFDVAVDDFDLVKKSGELTANFKQFKIDQAHFELDPQALHINEIHLIEPNVFLRLEPPPEKGLEEGSKSKELAPAKEQKALVELFNIKKMIPWDLQLAKVAVHKGSFQLKDLSLVQEMNLLIKDFNTELKQFSSLEQSDLQLKLDASIEDIGQFNYQSNFLLNSPEVEGAVNVSLNALPMTSLSPYGATFTHYPFSEGSLSFNVANEIRKNKINGKMGVSIKRIGLGDYVEGDERAMDLPLKFGISLLQDANRKIAFHDIPIHGDLADPKFRLWGLIWKVLSNVCVKAVSSPFKYLTSLVGSSSEELESLIFGSGELEPSEAMKQQLLKVAQALKERPSLKLTILSYGQTEADEQSLREKKFEMSYQAYLNESDKDSEADLDLPTTKELDGEDEKQEVDLIEEKVSRLLEFYYHLHPEELNSSKNKGGNTERVRKWVKVGRTKRLVYVHKIKQASTEEEGATENEEVTAEVPMLTESEARKKLIAIQTLSEEEIVQFNQNRIESLKKALSAIDEKRLLIKESKRDKTAAHFTLTIEP